jgi:hypothetical protein
METDKGTIAKDLRSLLTSEKLDPLHRNYEWAISKLVTNLATASSKLRSHGFADGFDYYETHRSGPESLEFKGIMHWTEGARGWVDPFVAKLWLAPSSQLGIGFEIHFGVAEEPTIVCGDPAHRRLRDKICSTSIEELSRRCDWGFEFRSDESGNAA